MKRKVDQEFVSFCSKITVSLRYADLISVLPTRISVLAWPMHHSKKNTTSTSLLGGHPPPVRLTYAEDALRTMSLPEGEDQLNQFTSTGSLTYISTNMNFKISNFFYPNWTLR